MKLHVVEDYVQEKRVFKNGIIESDQLSTRSVVPVDTNLHASKTNE